MVTRWKKEPHVGKHRTGLARARFTVSLCLLAGAFAESSAVAASRNARTSLNSKSVNLATSCTTDADCVDSNACLQGTCAEGICEFVERPDCLPCFGPPTCPPVEIVFLMDTSGSMVDEATAICENINQIVLDLAAGGMLITPHFLGITETPGEGFDCLINDVVTMLGGEVPGDAASCSFPDTFSAHESWGPATAVVAERFPWGDAVVRMIVPISDEGPCDGSFPDGCVDPGNDRDSITNAITVANANDVIVSPISGTSSGACVLTLASALATGTGGMAFASQDPHTDLADALIEIVSHVCEPAACDDGNFCTDDLCVNGICESTTIPDCCDLSETICETNDDCPEGACNPVTGLCICLPTLCLEIDVESNNGNACFEVGEEVLVHAVLGQSPPVNGGQFLVTYDPSVVEFIDAEPAHEVFVTLNGTPEVIQPGQVFYAIVPVIPTPAEPSVTGPVAVATFKFRVLAPCTGTDFCFLNKNPFNTFMMLFGQRVDVEFCCSELLSTSSGGPVLICPDSVAVNAEPGRLAATVTWDNVQVEPVCEGPVAVSCSAERPDGVPINHLIPNGGLFPSGHSTIECTATDESCGGEATCSWVISVSSANTVVADLQFAPTVTPGPLHRCIEFEFFANCVEESEIVTVDINFGLPFDLPGTAKLVNLKIAANKYVCVTARDPLHSLRSVAETQIDGDHWYVRFQGDPSLGGNWLVGGNLDGNRVIDVLDLGYVRAFMGETLGAASSCDRSRIHADINGDGIVDSQDELFVTLNMLTADNETCCTDPSAPSALDSAVTNISITELRQLGLAHLAAGDRNGDGWVNLDDVFGPFINTRPKISRKGGR